jgi:hypothetical protein
MAANLKTDFNLTVDVYVNNLQPIVINLYDCQTNDEIYEKMEQEPFKELANLLKQTVESHLDALQQENGKLEKIVIDTIVTDLITVKYHEIAGLFDTHISHNFDCKFIYTFTITDIVQVSYTVQVIVPSSTKRQRYD